MRIRDQDGQALPLALMFVIVVSLIIAAMLSYAGASVLSIERLRDQRSTVYAADGATDAVIQIGLADNGAGGLQPNGSPGTLGAFGDPRCHATVPTSPTLPIVLTTTATTSDATTATVLCTWSQDILQPNRTVTFTTFVGASPVVQAQVLYHDDKNPVTAVVQSWTYCGHASSC
jgi:hypothetical protein